MDAFITKYLHKARNSAFLIRSTIGLRILLAIAFIPTGAVKLMGRRFTTGIPEEGSPLILFEALYQSVHYWKFIGFIQIVAGILILFHRTSSIGSILFLAIASNILFITISYDFGLTIIISSGITLAGLWLIFWHWDRIRYLFIKDINVTPIVLNERLLTNKLERGIYITGFFSGLLLFSVLRGLKIPIFTVYISVLISIACFVLAVIFGIRNRNEFIDED